MANSCIIYGPNFLLTGFRINMNQLNTLHGDEKRSKKPTFWSSIEILYLSYKISPLISGIMGVLNHNDVDNGDVEVYCSEYPLEYTSDSVPYTYITESKSIGGDEMYQPLIWFNSYHDDDILNVYLQMLQAWLVVTTS